MQDFTKRVLLVCFLSFLMISASTYGQTEKLKVVFIYNFTKYIQWPSEATGGSFVIGVLGNSDITQELEKMTKSRKVGGQAIEVKQYTSVEDIGDEQILYVTLSESNKLPLAVQKLGTLPTLVLTEKKGLGSQGSGINFLIENDKLLFEINKASIEAHSLKVSSQLLSLGKQVL